MVKKTKKPPVKNGKKKTVTQKQKQSIVVNINTGKTRILRQPVKPSKPKQYPQYITTYPVFMETPPSLPIVYNPVKVHEPAPVKTNTIEIQANEPVMTNTIGINTTPKTVNIRVKRQSRIPVRVEQNLNMGDIYGKPDFIAPSTDKTVLRNKKTPLYEPTDLLPDFYNEMDDLDIEKERKRLLKNAKAREKRNADKMNKIY
jgi:hypothetical protein